MNKYFIPLWTISFSEKTEDFRQNAEITYAKKAPKIPVNPRNQLLVLNFLDELNNSFRKTSEEYFKHLETYQIERQWQDVRQKFDALQRWIDLIKSLLNPPK